MTTLLEFLTARIDEDEDPDRTSMVGAARRDWHARWLAECAAKRTIVEKFDEDPWCLDGGHVYTDFALRALAQPYADHPDFDPRWVL